MEDLLICVTALATAQRASVSRRCHEEAAVSDFISHSNSPALANCGSAMQLSLTTRRPLSFALPSPAPRPILSVVQCWYTVSNSHID